MTWASPGAVISSPSFRELVPRASSAAAGAAGSPFLTYYAQETRMYSLVVLLSILASASFVLAFVRGERRHVAWLGVWLTLLLYTHTWGLFMAAAMASPTFMHASLSAGAGRRRQRRGPSRARHVSLARSLDLVSGAAQPAPGTPPPA